MKQEHYFLTAKANSSEQELEAKITKAKHSTHISEEHECLRQSGACLSPKQACMDPIYCKDQRTKHKQTESKNKLTLQEQHIMCKGIKI